MLSPAGLRIIKSLLRPSIAGLGLELALELGEILADMLELGLVDEDGEIEADVFAKKQTELRDRLASLKLQLDAIDRSSDEMTDLVSKVFELPTGRRNSKLRNEKALRRSRRRASCPVESG